jgi:hypothetical protein
MAATRRIIFDANSLLKLLSHYTQDSDNSIPLDAELIDAGVSSVLGSWIGLNVQSDRWDGPEVEGGHGLRPLHIRYEGKRVMSWDSKPDTSPTWHDAPESPR